MIAQPQRPTTNEDRPGWKVYWAAQGMPWRTEPEIDAKRQALLAAKRQIAANPESGSYSFSSVKLTRGDVEWLLATHQSDGLIGPVLIDDERHHTRSGIDLRGADLSGKVDLSNLPLARAQFGTSLSAETEGLIKGGKRSRIRLHLYALVLLLVMEFLIAIPTPRISFIIVDPGGYLFWTIGGMYGLGLVGSLMVSASRRLRALFGVELVEYVVLTAVAAGMLIICLVAITILWYSTDRRGYVLGSDIVLSIALDAVGLYFVYRLWRARTLHDREYRFRLIRQSGANLSGCQLEATHLEEATLGGANLIGGNLKSAYLGAANLDLAKCQGADLRDSSISGESSLKLTIFGARAIGRAAGRIGGVPVRVAVVGLVVVGAILGAKVGITTGVSFFDVVFGAYIGAGAGFFVGFGIGLARSYSAQFATALGGVDWSQCDITQINWDHVTALGDEFHVESGDVLALYAVIKLYRALAHQLREAGFITAADRLTYRSLIVQRKIRLRESGIPPFLGSYLLDVLAGYGYKPLRTVVLYLVTIFTFAVAYYFLAPLSHVSFSLPASLFFSMASFHGRGFFPGANTTTETLAPDAPIVAIAALEALFGLFVEISFIATFTQRFFNAR